MASKDTCGITVVKLYSSEQCGKKFQGSTGKKRHKVISHNRNADSLTDHRTVELEQYETKEVSEFLLMSRNPLRLVAMHTISESTEFTRKRKSVMNYFDMYFIEGNRELSSYDRL